MRTSPEYEALCELCDEAGWRLELGRHVIPVVNGTLWSLRVSRQVGDAIYAEVKFAPLDRCLRTLVERVHNGIVREGWLPDRDDAVPPEG